MYRKLVKVGGTPPAAHLKLTVDEHHDFLGRIKTIFDKKPTSCNVVVDMEKSFKFQVSVRQASS